MMLKIFLIRIFNRLTSAYNTGGMLSENHVLICMFLFSAIADNAHTAERTVSLIERPHLVD